MSAECKSCRAAIFWAVTPSGNRMPIDAEPSPRGTLILRKQAQDDGCLVLEEPLIAIDYRAAGAQPDEPRFLSHFATCGQAGEWRKK